MSINVAEWSITPGSNTSVDGVAIGENCPFSNMNNMGRAIMAAVKLEVASIGANVSAAATPDIGSVGGAVSMLGVTTVTGFATAPAGLLRTIHFETATPIVPGANLSAPFTSITMQKGDVQVQRSLGSGAWKVEYNSRYNIVSGKHKLWIPASAMLCYPASTTAFTEQVATAYPYASWDFDQSTIEAVYFTISMPSSWNEGTVTFVPVWTAAAGSGDVIWAILGVARGNDDAIAAAAGASATSTDTLIATGDLHRGPESSAFTIDGSPAANDTVFFFFRRNATDGSDTLTADAKLIGVELYITTDAAVDTA